MLQQQALGMKKYFDGERGPDLRTRPPGMRKTFEVGKMWEVHQEITRLIFLGMKNEEIAERLNISPVTVSYTRNSRVVQDKLELMKGARDAEVVDLGKEIRMKAPKALKLLEDIVNGEEVNGQLPGINLRARTAENWMDRAGYPAQKAGSGVHLHAHFTVNEIDEIKKRALESGIVIDVGESSNEEDMGLSGALQPQGELGRS